MDSVVNSLIPLVENGVFGEVKFVDLKLNDQTEVGAQFASSLLFLNLVVKDSSGEKVLPIVVKLSVTDPVLRKERNVDAMFCNEVNMYKEILPALSYEENKFPKMYYGIATSGTNPEKDIVILENLQYKGFVPSKPKIFLDFEHISLAIKTIAKFHSLSYNLKNKNKEKFYQLAKKVKFVDKSEKDEEVDAVISAGMKRGIEVLLKNNISNNQFEKCLQLFESPTKLIKLINHPEEPFAVICHGDFCNNNILFKYSESGEPTECAIFDFQLSYYSNPAIDVMFFLYMHTTSEFREKYWNEILKLYWDTLRRNVQTKIPSFQEYLEHFGKRAVFGYVVSSWFLPILVHINDSPSEEKFGEISIEEKIHFFKTVAGEKGDKITSDIILHLLKMNYLQKVLDFHNEKKI